MMFIIDKRKKVYVFLKKNLDPQKKLSTFDVLFMKYERS